MPGGGTRRPPAPAGPRAAARGLGQPPARPWKALFHVSVASVAAILATEEKSRPKVKCFVIWTGKAAAGTSARDDYQLQVLNSCRTPACNLRGVVNVMPRRFETRGRIEAVRRAFPPGAHQGRLLVPREAFSGAAPPPPSEGRQPHPALPRRASAAPGRQNHGTSVSSSTAVAGWYSSLSQRSEAHQEFC